MFRIDTDANKRQAYRTRCPTSAEFSQPPPVKNTQSLRAHNGRTRPVLGGRLCQFAEVPGILAVVDSAPRRPSRQSLDPEPVAWGPATFPGYQPTSG